MPTGEFSGSNRCSPSSTGSFADLGPLHNKHIEYCGDHITQIWRKCHCLGQMDLVMSGFHHYGCGGIFLDFGKQEVQQEGTGQSKKQQEIDKWRTKVSEFGQAYDNSFSASFPHIFGHFLVIIFTEVWELDYFLDSQLINKEVKIKIFLYFSEIWSHVLYLEVER